MPKQKVKQLPPIQEAIQIWLAALPSSTAGIGEDQKRELSDSAPKGFAIYEPLALLPSGSFSSDLWATTLSSLDANDVDSLWLSILNTLSRGGGRKKVTHLAINEGIPLRKDGGDGGENVRRSPSGLRMLHGDFGGDIVGEPTEDDLERAFWVGTKQNGIVQTWAPRWTMFSRGNVKEKARVLGFKDRGATPDRESWAVDLYGGIGYFTFSYAALGMRVLCWEINPLSVEGLRRGAVANRWSARVVKGDELALPTGDVVAKGGERIVAFLESNEEALGRIGALQRDAGLVRDIKHVNCGYLPTSEPTWRQAWDMTKYSPEAWLHLHENVGVRDLESRRRAIQEMMGGWAAEEGGERVVDVEHIEQVKTFAPDVWHCVFDVRITACRNRE